MFVKPVWRHVMSSIKSRFQGCMLGMAIGDSLGYQVEFVQSKKDILAITDGGVKDLTDPALFSDDTQMNICVAHALIDSEGDHDRFMDSLCRYFLGWYKTQVPGSPDRRDPGESCLAGCRNLDAGASWETSGVDSKGCGAAMRTAPIGLYWNEDLLQTIEWGRDSSIPTHNNPTAMASAAAVSMMALLAVNDVPVGLWAHEIKLPLSGVCCLPGVHDYSVVPTSEPPKKDEFMDVVSMAAECASRQMDPWKVMTDDYLGEGWTAHSAVASALFCAMTNPDFEGAVLTAANTVGDSDSIACITGALVGARLGIESIPERWIEKIEAKDALFEVADRLYEASIAS